MGRKPSLFLNLPAELRNRIYELVVIPTWNDPCPLHRILPQRHTRNLRPLKKKKKRRTFSYPMGLALVCKQLRTEYLPIYFREATMAVRWNDLEDFQKTFHANRWDVGTYPRDLIVYMHTKTDIREKYMTIDVAPLLMLKATDAEYSCQFEVDPVAIYGWDTPSVQSICDRLNALFNMDIVLKGMQGIFPHVIAGRFEKMELLLLPSEKDDGVWGTTARGVFTLDARPEKLSMLEEGEVRSALKGLGIPIDLKVRRYWKPRGEYFERTTEEKL